MFNFTMDMEKTIKNTNVNELLGKTAETIGVYNDAGKKLLPILDDVADVVHQMKMNSAGIIISACQQGEAMIKASTEEKDLRHQIKMVELQERLVEAKKRLKNAENNPEVAPAVTVRTKEKDVQ